MANDPLLKKKPFFLLENIQSIQQGRILVLDGQAQHLILGINGGITFATGVLTITAQPGNGETVTVWRDVYTWVTALSSNPATEDRNEVLIGVDEVDSAVNFLNALTGGAGRGITYGEGTLRSINVDAVSGGAGIVNLTSRFRGVDGNVIATTETMAAGSFAAGTLLGGTDGVYTLEFRATLDGVNWFIIRGEGVDDGVFTGSIVNDIGHWRFDVGGLLAFKVDIFAYTSGVLNGYAMTDRMSYS
jgi:hypothetical protein